MNLQDCSKIELNKLSNFLFPELGRTKREAACREWLSALAVEVQANDLVIPVSKQQGDVEPIVYTDFKGQWWVGRYIGAVEFMGRQITIEPRFGEDFITRQFNLNKFALVDVKGRYKSGLNSMQYLQALLWVNLFAKAAKHSLPKEKVYLSNNGFQIRGTIDVRQTARNRIRGSEKVVSIFPQKTLLNQATVALALAYNEIQSWFPLQNLMHWLPDTLALRLQQMLSIVGRHEKVPSSRDIRAIRYSSLTQTYRPLVILSMQILEGRGIELSSDADTRVKGLLLDVADLWEQFVLEVLRSAVGDKLEIKHGTMSSDDFLLANGRDGQKLGKLIPDFLVMNKGIVRMVADAKYKRLGDMPWDSPQRDDLYQMTAYVEHYRDSVGSPAQGLLVYPRWQGNRDELSNLEKSNPWHFSQGNKLSFLTIPTNHDDAVREIQAHSSFESLVDVVNQQVRAGL